MTFDKKPCVDFEPAKVVVLGKGKSAALTGTLRPVRAAVSARISTGCARD